MPSRGLNFACPRPNGATPFVAIISQTDEKELYLQFNRHATRRRANENMADYKNINIRNKRATFDYEILEEYVAGVVLVGTEIKSIRMGKVSMTDSYCYFDRGELWIRGVNIAEYSWGSCNNHVPKRDRKLLLNAKELAKLSRAMQDKGLTIVGLRLFLNDRGLAKIVVGLARGRKSYDKREYLKENDAKREMDKALKRFK